MTIVLSYRILYKCLEITAHMIPDTAHSTVNSWEQDHEHQTRLYMVLPPSTSSGKPTVMTDMDFRDLFVQVQDDSDDTTCIERKLYQCRYYPPKHSGASGRWDVTGCSDICAVSSLGEAITDQTYEMSPFEFHQQFEIVSSHYFKDGDDLSMMESSADIAAHLSILNHVKCGDHENNPHIDVPFLAARHRRLHQHGFMRLLRQGSDLSVHSATLRNRRQSLTRTPSGSPLRRAGSLRWPNQPTPQDRGLVGPNMMSPGVDLSLPSDTVEEPRSDEEPSLSNSIAASTSTLFNMTDVYSLGDGPPTSSPESAIPRPVSPIAPLGAFFDITASVSQTDTLKHGPSARTTLTWAGYLEKKGSRGLKSTWKKRWFELDQNNLAAGFVYYEYMPPKTKFRKSDNGSWELTGTSEHCAVATPSTASMLGAIPLLCCLVTTLVATNGEAVMSLRQQFAGHAKGSSKLGVMRSRSQKTVTTASQAAQRKDIGRTPPIRPSRAKRRSLYENDSRGTSLSPARSSRALARRSSMGSTGGESRSVSPPPSREHDTSAESSDDDGPFVDLDNMLDMEGSGRTYLLRMDGNFGVRGGLEQLLRESSMFVTLSVFHSACALSTRACKLSGKLAAEHREKTAILVKHCLSYLLHAYGGNTRFIMEGLPSKNKMSMGNILEPFLDKADSKNQFLHALQEADEPSKVSKPPLHAAAKAMNSAVLSVSAMQCIVVFNLLLCCCGCGCNYSHHGLDVNRTRLHLEDATGLILNSVIFLPEST